MRLPGDIENSFVQAQRTGAESGCQFYFSCGFFSEHIAHSIGTKVVAIQVDLLVPELKHHTLSSFRSILSHTHHVEIAVAIGGNTGNVIVCSLLGKGCNHRYPSVIRVYGTELEHVLSVSTLFISHYKLFLQKIEFFALLIVAHIDSIGQLVTTSQYHLVSCFHVQRAEHVRSASRCSFCLHVGIIDRICQCAQRSEASLGCVGIADFVNNPRGCYIKCIDGTFSIIDFLVGTTCEDVGCCLCTSKRGNRQAEGCHQ